MPITQVITTLPTAPDPATMTSSEFSAAAAASVLAQKAMVPEINTWTTQVNAIVSGTAGDIASGINGATAKTTPVDADLMCLTDSAASWVLKKLTWANLKATLGSTSKTILATRDMTAASGSVAYTGVGFNPRCLHIIAFIDGATAASFGIATTTSEYAMAKFGGAATAQNLVNGAIVYVSTDAAGSDNQNCLVAAMDADGFTLTWSKGGTPTGTMQMMITAFK